MNEELWEATELVLPNGYRFIACVDRPGSDGNVFTPADTYDLGQNAEGNFLLFRRNKDPWSWNSHHKGERLSDEDINGFALLGVCISRAQCVEPEIVEEQGNYSSLCYSNLIKGV